MKFSLFKVFLGDDKGMGWRGVKHIDHLIFLKITTPIRLVEGEGNKELRLSYFYKNDTLVIFFGKRCKFLIQSLRLKKTLFNSYCREICKSKFLLKKILYFAPCFRILAKKKQSKILKLVQKLDNIDVII